MAGLYIHIPICRRICAYCDFFRVADLRPLGEVVEAMHRELDGQAAFLPVRKLRSIYFGGGTPSLLNPDEIGRFIDHAARIFDCSHLEECTVEANPDDLSPDYLSRLARTGVNRLSIGVQSFDDAALRMMNRRHDAAAARNAVRQARQAGFDNVTIDLIFGVPGFGRDSLRRSLDEALALDVEHISAYHLTVEPDTAFGRRMARGEFRPVDEEVSEEEYMEVHRTLTDAGYEHYEVSNFARPGRRAIHNSAYWSGEPYLGIGPAAHSFDGRRRRWAVADLARYLAADPSGAMPSGTASVDSGTEPTAAGRYEEELLTECDRRNETVMVSLRCIEGIDSDAFAARYGPAALDYLRRAAQPWIDSGDLVAHPDGRLAIPPERFLKSDAVIEALFMQRES